jgi:hypothetical protein
MSNDTAPKAGCAPMIAGGALLVFALTFFLLIERPGCGPLSNTTRSISGQVLDETGQPVPGVNVTLKWSVGIGLDPTKGRSEQHVVELTSDADGRFAGKGNSWYCGLHAKKEGYYPSSLSVDEKMPGDSLRILLNKVRHPQPMVGKKAKIRLIAGFNRLEYDLLMGECLPPHGAGSVADLVIEWRKPDSAKGEYPRDVISVRFMGSGNGAVTQRIKHDALFSALQSQHDAPEHGYAATFAEADQNAGGFTGEYYGALKIHYLKIRSELQPGPLFGKLRGDILYIPRPLSAEDEFEFEYVINPSGDRGLEMDMKRITLPGRHELEYAPTEF